MKDIRKLILGLVLMVIGAAYLISPVDAVPLCLVDDLIVDLGTVAPAIALLGRYFGKGTEQEG